MEISDKKSILVTIPLTGHQRQALEAQAPGCDFIYRPIKGLTDDLVHQAQIIIGNVPPGRITGSAALEWLHLNTAGATEFMPAGVFPAQAVLTNSTGAYRLAISELWRLKNAVVTPHISGYYHLPATLERIVTIATRNLGHYMRGEALENKVDFQSGYREFKDG